MHDCYAESVHQKHTTVDIIAYSLQWSATKVKVEEKKEHI